MTTFTGTIPTIASGDTTTVPTNLATYRDSLKAESEAWTSYTHGWTGTIGNGTIVAKWLRNNKKVMYRINLTWGSTTSHPASAQLFALPTATHADYTAGMHMGNGVGLDNGTTWGQFAAVWNSSTQIFVITTTGAQASNTQPWTWTTGDKLSIFGTYESA